MYLGLARHDARPVARALQASADPRTASGASRQPRRAHPGPELSGPAREQAGTAVPSTQALFGQVCSAADDARRRRPPPPARLQPPAPAGDPGPVLRGGDRMGENLEVDGRMSVRTPMQWNDGRNGGFSDASPSRLRRPVVEGRSARWPSTRRRNGATRTHPELDGTGHPSDARDTPVLGWGRTHVLDTGDDGVLAHRTDWGEDSVLLVHTLTASTSSGGAHRGGGPRRSGRVGRPAGRRHRPYPARRWCSS